MSKQTSHQNFNWSRRPQGSRRWKSAAFALASLMCVAFTQPAQAADRPTVIVVIGAQGAPEFGETFNKAADKWEEAAKKGNADFLLIGRDPLPETPAQGSAHKTDKLRLKERLETEAAEQNQHLWLVFIGHGTFDRAEAKFNLRDSDISDVELGQWARTIKRPFAVISCSSSSAPFLNRLSAPNRVVITATRTGTEINYSRLGEYLAASIADPTADLDKDGQTSLLEAFVAGAHRTKEFYDTEGRLMTEHALIDDNGDGQGTPAEWFQGIRVVRTAATARGGGGGGRGGRGAPGGAAPRGPSVPDGSKAHQWALVKSAEELQLSEEARIQRNDLENRIEVLRARKPQMTEEAYYTQLDALLLQLAEIYKSTGASIQTVAPATPMAK